MTAKQIIYGLIPIIGVSLAGGVVSCSDTWDDHYDEKTVYADQTLLQIIQGEEQLSDFLKVAQQTHLYNNNHKTPITFAELLGSDQSLTVWAPKNGTFNVESLLDVCSTEQGDSMVGLHFVGNHIAHTLYPSNKLSSLDYIKMYNDKYFFMTNCPKVFLSTDVPANNGLLNIVGSKIPYNYNLYEGLTSMGSTSHIGQFIKSYERQELDEDASIQRGIEDGKKVYSDSVMVKENILFRTFGYINTEDSSYFAIVPVKEAWEKEMNEAADYFYYGSLAKADSVSNYWRHLLLMRDLFYNDNLQRARQDSIYSTSYTRSTPEYHVFYRPFDAGGVLSNITDSTVCSNGKIYFIPTWPFTKEQSYFRPIRIEGEREASLIDNSDCTFNYRSALGDSISKGGYLDIVPKTSSSNWTTTFEVSNTLAGTYDVCVVLLPKTVYNPFSRDFKPNKFKATLNYTDSMGVKQQYPIDTEFSNDPYKVDTVKLCRFTIPVCNYGQQDVTVSLQLQCSITPRQVKFSREMLLDCIYLKPVGKEDEQ